MKHRIILRLAVVLLAMLGFAFGVINYGGNDYTEALLPLNLSGGTPARYVVMGESININTNAQGETEVNGVLYKNTNEAVAVAADDRYFIFYNPKNTQGTCDITGTNDWTTQDTSNISIGLPFSQNGSGSYFYVTTMEIDSLASTNIDFLLINNEDYTNQSTGTIPERKNGNYYIYYGATNTSAQLNLYWVPLLNVKVFLEGGF